MIPQSPAASQKEWKWRNKAIENTEKWGVQNIPELHDAMAEEFLELNHELMHFIYDDPDGVEDATLDEIEDELDDFMALGYQLIERLERDREGEDNG